MPCNTVDCLPPPAPAAASAAPRVAQAIDYMARDYDSLLRALVEQLPVRVPGWKDRSEADLGMAILELFAYVGDQLSYYQDRVANEGYLRTAQQYESVRRLLALIDYTLDPGRAAVADLLVQVAPIAPGPVLLRAGFQVLTAAATGVDPVVFETVGDAVLHQALNAVALHADAPAGAQSLELAATLDAGLLPPGVQLLLDAGDRREWIMVDHVDPPTTTTVVHLRAPLTADYPGATPGPGAVVRGNHVPATHGETHAQDAVGTGQPDQPIALTFAPLTHTLDAAGAPVSSLRVRVDGDDWHEVDDFIASDETDPHFRLSRDNDGYVTVHFGDGIHGRVPPPGARIDVRYRAGVGEAGLTGPDTLTVFTDPDDLVAAVTNPYASDDARDPETIDEGKLLGPRQLWQQQRVVTPDDYARVLLAGVRLGSEILTPLQAKADFRWTGSWTTAYVSVDMPDRVPLSVAARAAFEAALAANRLAGHDARVEDARYAPVQIALLIDVRPEFFARDVRLAVQSVLAGTPGSAPGFFAPGRFTFGQAVYLSDLYGVVTSVPGVLAVAVTRFKRLGDRYPDREADGFIDVGRLEIVRCDSDPAHSENGLITVRTRGGKEG